MLLDEWRELLGGLAPLVWAIVAFLATIWVFLPFWLYTDARRRDARPWTWVSVAVLVPIVGIPLGLWILPSYFPLWALGILVVPLSTLVAYLILRASARTCPECGRVMRPEWGFCPRHKSRDVGPAPLAGAPAFSASFLGDLGGGAYESPSAGPPLQMPREPMPEAGIQNAIAMLLVREGADRGRQFPITSGGLVVGRDADSGAVLADGSASGRHAQITVHDGRAQIIDLGSSNGTYVNDESVDRAFLYDGDSIRVGDTSLIYKELR